MKTLAVTVANKRQEKLFLSLADELGIEITEARFKPLSTKDAVLGIGKKFSEEQLTEYLTRKTGGKKKSTRTLKNDLRKRLSV